MSRQIHDKKKAFTLIEVMVVVAIIGILATMGVNSYTRALMNGRDAVRKDNVQMLAKALGIVWTENGGTAMKVNGSSITSTTNWGICSTLKTYNYVDKCPAHVGSDTDSSYKVTYSTFTPSGSTATMYKYLVCVTLENAKGGNSSSNTTINNTVGKYFCAGTIGS